MTDPPKYPSKFNDLQICVIIPTYNNEMTLGRVIGEVLDYTDNLIVVDDGSTDRTTEILNSFPSITTIKIDKNIGKGNALQMGFRKAVELKYRYAITIDSDGQHFAKDIPAFIDKIIAEPDSIIIGSRDMAQSSVPGKSNFGYRISNYWFKVETGVKAPDTQSGYRLYPVVLLKDIHFYTKKFEFEIEVIVRAAWKGIKITSVPITVYYAPGKERVSHFRPVTDFTRVGLLHSILVTISFLYIRPRNYLRILFHREKIKGVVKEHLLNEHQSDLLKSISIAFGIFMGIVPIWGFQMLVAIFIAIFFRLNKALVIIAANISIPPMIPLILYLSFRMGAIGMGDRASDLLFSKQITLQTVKTNWEQYLYGSLILAVCAAVVAGILTMILLKIFKRRIKYSN